MTTLNTDPVYSFETTMTGGYKFKSKSKYLMYMTEKQRFAYWGIKKEKDGKRD